MPRPATQPPAPAELALQPAERPLLFPHQAARVFDAVRRVALQSDLASAGYVVRHGIAELTASERVYCLFRDPGSGVLWSLDEGAPSARPADHAGITTFSARTGAPVATARAADSPLYRPELDDPEGDGSERLIVHPVSSAGAVIAVIAAVRRSSAPPYTPAERLAVAGFAEQCGPILQHFLLDHQLRSPAALPGADTGSFFGPDEPLAAARQGELLRLSPSWIRWSYGLLLVAVAAGLAFAAVATVHRYSAGAAVVRIDGDPVTALEEGVAAAVRVTAGTRVRKGDLLVELHPVREAGELEQLELEHEAQLAALLLDPSNQRARRALGVVSGRIDRARARLTGRSARAPRDGIVSDVRVRPGMLLAPGDHLMTVVGESATPTVIALLPARHRPELAAGMELRLELTGHSRADIRGVVEEVGGAVIGPREARRLVGADIGDALAIGGPVVVVRARLSQRTFESRGGSYAFHDGMLGTGEVQLGSSVLLSALIPGGDD